MRRLALGVLAQVLSACVANTIVLSSETDASDGATSDPATSTTTSVGTTTTTPGTTTVATTQIPPDTDDGPPPPPPLDLGDGCVPPPCDPGQYCWKGLCFWCDGPGKWVDCVQDDGTPDPSSCKSDLAVCAVDGRPATVGSCLFQGCSSACDCPRPPEGDGDAPVQCGDVLGMGPNNCYLSCELGEQCPAAMTCFDGQVCVFAQP